MTRRRSLLSIWLQRKPESLTDKYLTIVALEDGLTASLSTNACEYCIDGDGNWLSLAAGATTQSVNTGQMLSFRGNLTPKTNAGIGTFTISKKCNLAGNCMSMLFGDDAADTRSLLGKDFAFYELFYYCTNIVSVSENFLPAIALENYCYQSMFSGCTSLTTAPILPATALTRYCYSYMFQNCSSLTTAPELPATTLANYCYNSMFYGCSSLTTAPKLPITALTNYCYQSMFYGCTNLTTAPELPATILKTYCYASMFSGCTSLTTAPELPATTLASNCYQSMFSGCASLTITPELPATTLTYGCYYMMFDGCTSLTDASALPATALAEYCYQSMFSGCTRLTTAPDLPATTLAISCYNNMFRNCKKLNYIKMLATDISASSCLYSWVYGVASIGRFVKNPNMTSLPTGHSGIPSGWTVYNEGSSELFVVDNYLTIYALSDGLTASLSTNACEYCVDGDGNWKSLAAGIKTESINAGHSLSFRANLTPTSTGIGTFTIVHSCNLGGNCMSLLFGDNAASNTSLSGKNYAFYELFYNCTNIVSVSENFLPATTLADYCYDSMFCGCTELTTAPELPATTLAESCYHSMFSGCTELTTAPELPATALAEYCYQSMFSGCTRLTTAPVLPATTLANYCYQNMFWGCDRLTTAPKLPATTLTQYCYNSMFRGCSNLTTALELPATTLADHCYDSMFQYCGKLTIAPKLPATTLANYCYQYMFQYCDSLTTAPALPATTLEYCCYQRMFDGCKKLNYIKMLATDISADYCLSDWVSDVASTGTFVKNINMTTLPTATSSNGYVGIPSGWTIKDDYTPTSCTSLTITADDVSGTDTTTTIYYTAVTNGKDTHNNIINNVTITGTATSAPFAQNTSTTNTVQRTISYTYLGETATTTITQGVWVNSYYTIDLNNQWQTSTTVSNPDASEYDGVYESFSNYNIGNTAAIMKITIEGYSSFKFYIRSNAESNWDYVMVSQLDQTIDNNTSYSNTTLVKAYTRGNQQSGTALSNYTPVEFTNIDGGKHVITIVYRKDSSVNNGTDKGYVLIPKIA
jgi:predicted secreted protein